jgi:glyoxylase-like metal-dependent hydrolase (beta-lactamase superfamily II)
MEPAPGVLAWYDGRVPGYRWSEGPNWVDEGAMELGIASYAVWDGDEALVYDTHVSTIHAERIRADLAARGITRFTVVLSHWHLDHVAGTAIFADCPVIANVRTDRWLRTQRHAIEAGTLLGSPPIRPLVLPTRTFDGRLDRRVGARAVQLIAANIHSDDATVVFLPDARILLAGDTIEDPVTYVAEPQDFALHLADLRRLRALAPLRVLPAHGAPDRIASGGFGPGIIDAAIRYTEWLTGLKGRPELARPLGEVIGADVEAGTLVWCDEYEAVHQGNIARAVRGSRA